MSKHNANINQQKEPLMIHGGGLSQRLQSSECYKLTQQDSGSIKLDGAAVDLTRKKRCLADSDRRSPIARTSEGYHHCRDGTRDQLIKKFRFVLFNSSRMTLSRDFCVRAVILKLESRRWRRKPVKSWEAIFFLPVRSIVANSLTFHYRSARGNRSPDLSHQIIYALLKVKVKDGR